MPRNRSVPQKIPLPSTLHFSRSMHGRARSNLWVRDPLASVEALAPGSLIIEKVPIVVGVTGHRELRREDEEGLLQATERVLSRLKARRSPETPMVLLSPLAEGADRIVARAALGLGIHLVVPLPMPRDEYERDFPDSVNEFHDFLSHAHDVFELPMAVGNSRSNIAQQDRRDLQYKAVGQYIARHCEELIALWDGHGRDDEAGCGTAAVVRYKMEGVDELVQFDCSDALGPVPSGRNLLEPTECGPVRHVWTRRRGGELSEGVLFEARDLIPKSFGSSGRAEKYYEAIFARIDRFNRDVASADAGFRAFIHKQRESLIPAKARWSWHRTRSRSRNVLRWPTHLRSDCKAGSRRRRSGSSGVRRVGLLRHVRASARDDREGS